MTRVQRKDDMFVQDKRLDDRVSDLELWRRLYGAGGGSGGVVNLDAWHSVGNAGEPAFQNSWVNYGGSYQTAGFRKDPFGRVYLKGLIKGGANATVAFTLPVGYRPPKYIHMAAASNDAYATVRVDSTGTVQIGNPANTAWASLDELSFDTESVSTYPVGPVGPAGPTGPAGVVPRGPWSAATAYAVNDIVQYGGSEYRRLVAGTTATAPDVDGTNWQLFISKGDQGPQGIKGDQGTQGIPGVQLYYEQPADPGAVNNGALWVDTDETVPGATWPLRVTSLPSTPYDGQEVYLVVDSAKNVLWHMRYYAAGSKWEAVSGAPIFYTKSMNGPNTALTLGAVLTGLNITIPALPVASHARVACKFRVNHVGAAGWTYNGSQIRCTPAPVAYGTSGLWDTLLYTYGSGGPLYITHTPHNYFDLAVNTAYTIDVMFNGAAAVFNWDPEQAFLEAEVSPR
jgi:hypothetical protein